MTVNKKRGDLRIIKTENALSIALPALLECYNFRKITVSDLCAQALISRATFYAHFSDKYSLLKFWLESLKLESLSKCGECASYENLETFINQFVHRYKQIIKNIVEDADGETLDILSECLLSLLDLPAGGKNNLRYTVFSNFCAGGMIFYLSWQVKNRFPANVPIMNVHYYEIITKIQKWSLE